MPRKSRSRQRWPHLWKAKCPPRARRLPVLPERQALPPAGDAAKKGAPGAEAARKGAPGAEPAKGAEAKKDEGKKESPKKEGGKK